MDLSDYEGRVSLNYGYDGAWISVSGIHRAVYEGDLDAVKRMIESGESVNRRDCEGYAPLHMAAMQNQLGIMEYLLSRGNVDPDPRCTSDVTPLYHAAVLGHTESVKRLFEAGASVNSRSNSGYTPLHISAEYPEVALFLIQNGAEIDAVTEENETALHFAVKSSCLEVVCMLLYYNADPDVPDTNNCTPFMQAMRYGSAKIQRTLIEYVNHEEFLENEEDLWLIPKLFNMQMASDTLTIVTCLLLQQGLVRVTSSHISTIFSHYGYSELIEILLYMDNDYEDGWSVDAIMPRAIFDTEYKLEDMVEDAKMISNENIVMVLEYFRYLPLIDSLLSNRNYDNQTTEILTKLSKVPLLTELARNAARQHIRKSYRTKSTCHFYTVIDHLDIPRVCKRILKFEKKLYTVKL